MCVAGGGRAKGWLAPRNVFVTWLLMTGAAFGLGLYARIRYRYSGVIYGILVSIVAAAVAAVGAVAFLIAGTCSSGGFRLN